MKNLILSAAIVVATFVGSLAWTETADARPRGYYRAPAARYYQPNYAYRPYYRQSYGYRSYYRPSYGYRSYYRPSFGYGYPYRSYYGGSYYGSPYVGSRVYIGW
ncbi:MAG TPA: hypothetical protein VMP01_17510 [Pirellulaceae bacterium]|nr:hypothetical protein [Pirellulaceae bacterium]